MGGETHMARSTQLGAIECYINKIHRPSFTSSRCNTLFGPIKFIITVGWSTETQKKVWGKCGKICLMSILCFLFLNKNLFICLDVQLYGAIPKCRPILTVQCKDIFYIMGTHTANSQQIKIVTKT